MIGGFNGDGECEQSSRLEVKTVELWLEKVKSWQWLGKLVQA
jgi:hypothetical protein